MTDDLEADDYEVVMQYDDATNSALALLEHHIDVPEVSATPASSTTSFMGRGVQFCAGEAWHTLKLPCIAMVTLFRLHAITEAIYSSSCLDRTAASVLRPA
ncbi:hypothetical protein MRX96_002589 [Rhipicephalus microplus]